MPKTYSYHLSNGKTLDLEGDTQPTDAEVEAIAKEHNVSLMSASADEPEKPPLPATPRSYLDDALSTAKGFAEGVVPGALRGITSIPRTLLDTANTLSEFSTNPMEMARTAMRVGRSIPGTLKRGYEAIVNPTPVEGEPTAETSGRNIGEFVGEQAGPMALGTSEVLHPLQAAWKVGAAANRAAATGMRVMENNPIVSAGVGGAIGYGLHGIPGAIEGAILGPPSTRAIRVLGKMAERAKPPSVPVVDAVPVEPPPAPMRPLDAVVLGESNPRKALPPGADRVITPPPSTARPLSDDPSFVKSVPAQRGLPVRDPTTGRMKRVYTSESSTGGEKPITPKTETPSIDRHAFPERVKELTTRGYGAEEIVDMLKDDPMFTSKPKAERINLVREARGGSSGQMPGRAQAAIDEAISKLKTAAEKRAYLLKAPNAVAYDYIKGKLGL